MKNQSSHPTLWCSYARLVRMPPGSLCWSPLLGQLPLEPRAASRSQWATKRRQLSDPKRSSGTSFASHFSARKNPVQFDSRTTEWHDLGGVGQVGAGCAVSVSVWGSQQEHKSHVEHMRKARFVLIYNTNLMWISKEKLVWRVACGVRLWCVCVSFVQGDRVSV